VRCAYVQARAGGGIYRGGRAREKGAERELRKGEEEEEEEGENDIQFDIHCRLFKHDANEE
jgi:hypothetical protein